MFKRGERVIFSSDLRGVDYDAMVMEDQKEGFESVYIVLTSGEYKGNTGTVNERALKRVVLSQ